MSLSHFDADISGSTELPPPRPQVPPPPAPPEVGQAKAPPPPPPAAANTPGMPPYNRAAPAGHDAAQAGAPAPPPIPVEPALPPPPPPAGSSPPSSASVVRRGTGPLGGGHVGAGPGAGGGPAEPPPVASGVGSARGFYWRDQLAIDPSRKRFDGGVSQVPGNRPPAAAVVGEAAREEADPVERTAPAWLISLVLHLVLMLVLALIASPVGRQMTTIVLEVGQVDDGGEDLESFELDVAEPEIQDATPMEVVDLAEAVVEMPQEQFTADSLIETIAPVQVDVASVSLPTEGMMSGRLGATKEALLAAYGGTAETENAVQLGLRWLKKQQLSSGAWSLIGPYEDGAYQQNQVAATAMAMLAFQGNGHTHQSGEYRDTVKQAVEWLVRQQGRNGAFGRTFPSHQKLYSQAQATIAICELYAMTGDSWLRDPAQRAIDYAVQSQSSMGGWRYEPREDADTSVTGWFVMALQSGRDGGLEVPDDVFHKVGYYLDSVQHYDGAAYAYQPGNSPSEAMTAEGMLCRQYLGWPRDSLEMQRCALSLSSDYNFDINQHNSYYWYYATQMLHHFGGSPWREWNEVMREELPAAQVVTGPEAGSWAPQRDRWAGTAGRLYATCMAIYCLEVYYRHLPLYDKELR